MWSPETAQPKVLHSQAESKAKDQLEALLLAGLQGEATELTSEDWRAIRTEAMAKVTSGKTAR